MGPLSFISQFAKLVLHRIKRGCDTFYIYYTGREFGHFPEYFFPSF